MIDIVSIEDGEDLTVVDTAVSKAGNVLAVQLGSLEYAPTFGVDLRYFLQSGFKIQNESFKAYLVDRLVKHQINVSTVLETVETFSRKFTFKVGDANQIEGEQGLIR